MVAPTLAPPVTFLRLDEIPKDGPTSVLYYGGSKTGKTWFLGTAGDRSLLLDTGDGIDCLKSKYFREKVGAKPIVASVREKIGDRGVVEGVAQAFDLAGDILDYAIKNMLDQFDTIACDELSSLRKFALHKSFDVNFETGKSKTKNQAEKYDFMMPAVQDWGVEMNLIEQFLEHYISKFKGLGKNFIVSAHQRYVLEKPKDAKGSPLIGEPPVIREIRPAVTGSQFPDTISGLFDNVWHAERVGGGDTGTVYRARVYGDEVTIAGSRNAGVFKTVEQNPNFLEMLKRIRAASL